MSPHPVHLFLTSVARAGTPSSPGRGSGIATSIREVGSSSEAQGAGQLLSVSGMAGPRKSHVEAKVYVGTQSLSNP